MKYLVRRWHSGVRIAGKLNSRHHRHLSGRHTESQAPPQFQVGQPVSSQFFSNNAPGYYGAAGPKNYFQGNGPDSRENNAFGYEEGRLSPASSTRDHPPWSGKTPPSKEDSERRRIRIGSQVLNREDMTPLKAPQLLAQFVERFDQIQEKLGVALDSNAA